MIPTDLLKRAGSVQGSGRSGGAARESLGQGVAGFAERRTQMLDDLADALEEHVDLPALLELALSRK